MPLIPDELSALRKDPDKQMVRAASLHLKRYMDADRRRVWPKFGFTLSFGIRTRANNKWTKEERRQFRNILSTI